MKIKRIAIVFVALLMVAGLSYAGGGMGTAPAYTNAIYVGGNGKPGTPPQEYVLVRYAESARNTTTISSGDALSWSVTSADGFTISRCILDAGTKAVAFAGVAVGDILSADNNSINLRDGGWGYMCIRGYCLAKVDSTGAVAGQPLKPSGATLSSSLSTQVTSAMGISQDIGILLKAPDATDGLAPVILR